MSILSWLPMMLGSLTTWYRVGRQGITQGQLQGAPPVDYTILTQAELLASFSDAIGPDGITPRSMRNFVASTVTMNPGGIPPSIPLPLPGWTTATRPPASSMVGPAIGFNYDLQQLDMWDDRLQTWVNPSFQGGIVGGVTTFANSVAFEGPVVGFTSQVTMYDGVIMPGLPATCTGQQSGKLWNNGQTVSICP